MSARRSLRNDRRGVTVVEFGLIAPTMCLILLALGDLLHRGYVQGLLDGEMQKAARDSAIEGGALKVDEIDARMRAMVQRVSPNATVEPIRESYSTFQNMSPERFDDDNDNSQRDAGECFDDINGNDQWDARPSRKGQGGANDVTLYRATVSWPRLFPLGGFLGWPDVQTIASETILRNQPFAKQVIAGPKRVCT